MIHKQAVHAYCTINYQVSKQYKSGECYNKNAPPSSAPSLSYFPSPTDKPFPLIL